MKQSQLIEYESGGMTCDKCGGKYKGLRGLSKHHKAQHGEKWSPLASCDYCGQLYQENCENLNTPNNTYCSDSCRKEAFSLKKPHNKSHEVRKCDRCGVKYEVREKSDKRFCNRECYHSYNKETGRLKGESNPQYKEPVELECEECSETYFVPPVHSGSRFCSTECHNEHKRSITGPEHPLYKGGYDYYVAIRSGLSSVGWETHRQRHNKDECEICGAETSPHGNDLSLHHIVPVLSGGTNGAYNFMTLCEPCHSKAESYCSDLPGFGSVLVE
jgi:hypothetical protein